MHTSLIMSTNRITVTVDEKTLENLDEFRGLTKRSTIIQKILSDFLSNSEGKNPSVKVSKTTKSSSTS